MRHWPKDDWKISNPKAALEIEQAIEERQTHLDGIESQIDSLQDEQNALDNEIAELTRQLEAARLAESRADAHGVGATVRVSVCGVPRRGRIVRVETEESLVTVEVDGNRYIYGADEVIR